MVLRCDLDQTRLEILHRVVRGVVAERQAACVRPGGATDDLVPKADAQKWPPVCDGGTRESHRAVEPGGIAGAGRAGTEQQFDAIGLTGLKRRRIQHVGDIVVVGLGAGALPPHIEEVGAAQPRPAKKSRDIALYLVDRASTFLIMRPSRAQESGHARARLPEIGSNS